MRTSSLTVLLLALGVGSPAMAALDTAVGSNSYESALEFFQNGRPKIAVSQLKQVLSDNPNDLPSRILLGEVYLNLGFAAAAEVQFREALRGGANLSSLVVPLATALFEQRKFDTLLDEFHAVGHVPEVQTGLLVLRGLARLEQREPEAAAKAFADALRISPTEGAPYLGRAQVRLFKGQLSEAERDARTATEFDPGSAQAWYVRGIIATHMSQNANAHDYLSKSLDINPQNMPARAARATLDIHAGRMEAAREDVEFVRNNTPDDAQAAYLHARILEHDGKTEEALSALAAASSTITALPPEYVRNHAPTLMLSGYVSIALKKYEEAFKHFSIFVARFPSHLGARQVLARLHIRRKELRDAFDVLQPVFARSGNDARMLALRATLLVGLGRNREAVPVLAALHREDPDDVQLLMRYARALLQSGDRSTGFELLNRVLELEPENELAALTLGTSSMQVGDAERALEMADQVLKHNPESVNAFNLKGTALIALKKAKEGRLALEQGLLLAPGHVSMSRNLARMLVIDGNIEAATAIYDKVLEVHPESLSTMLQYAAVLEKNGRYAESEQVLQKARSVAGLDVTPSIRLIDQYLRRSNLDGARSVLRELEAEQRENLAVMEARGRVEIARGESYKARATFENMARLAGFDGKLLRQIAQLQMRVEDYAGARWSLQKATKSQPGDVRPLIGLLKVELRMGQASKARKHFAKLEELMPDQPNLHSLRGDILIAESRFEEAAAAYELSMERAGRRISSVVIKRYKALGSADQVQAAEQYLLDWLRTNPDDVIARMQLGAGYVRAGDLERARGVYEEVLTRRPGNIMALNNLASLLRDSDPARALELAQRAYDLEPEMPPVLDTLGWVLVKQGEYDRGLKLLRTALARAGSRPEINYHIAVALDGAGRRDSAVKQLRAAVNSSRDFPGRSEAEALLSTWQN
ncbi:MAG: XrtA/PEP-CTERM system TPR-repeat protein PrsT [Pseudomonadota bacterium]